LQTAWVHSSAITGLYLLTQTAETTPQPQVCHGSGWPRTRSATLEGIGAEQVKGDKI